MYNLSSPTQCYATRAIAIRNPIRTYATDHAPWIGGAIMRVTFLVVACLGAHAEYSQPKKPPAGVDPATSKRRSPFVDGNRLLIDGKVSTWTGERGPLLLC